MKNKHILILFFLTIISLQGFSEDIERQIIELIGGIFPNSDLKTNTYLEIGINYTLSLKTTLIVDMKDHSTAEKKYLEDETEETIDINKKTLIDFKLIEWAIPIIENKSFAMKITPGIKVDYLYVEKSYQYQDIWEDDFGMNQLYIENDDIITHSLLPILTTSLDFRFSKYFDFIVGIGVLPYGFDWTDYSEYDASSDPAEQDAFYQQNSDSFFTSMGIEANINSYIKNTGIGDIRLDITGLYKIGTSQNHSKEWDENNLEFYTETWDSEEQRIQLYLNLFYFMNYLKINNIIPILKVGFDLEYTFQDGEIDEQSSYHQFDFGIALKY